MSSKSKPPEPQELFEEIIWLHLKFIMKTISNSENGILREKNHCKTNTISCHDFL